MSGCYRKNGFSLNVFFDFMPCYCYSLLANDISGNIGCIILKTRHTWPLENKNSKTSTKNAVAKQIIVIKFHGYVVFKVIVWISDFVTKRIIKAI